MAAVLTAKIRATIIWLQTTGAIPWRVSSLSVIHASTAERTYDLLHQQILYLRYLDATAMEPCSASRS